MRQVIGKAKSLNSDRVGLHHRQSATTYNLAKHLDEIAEGQYAEVTLGVAFRVFVTQLRDDNGLPRNYTWAKGLMSQLRKVRKHPYLVTILERQSVEGEDFVTFSSAFYAAKLAETDNWGHKVAAELREEGCERGEWEKDKKSKLLKRYYEWGCKSTRAIKDRIKELNNDKADEETPSAWPFHGGRVDPNVKERYDSALERLARLVRGESTIDSLSYVQEIETVAEGVSDIFDALELAATGNTKLLQPILEQLAGETNG